MEIQRSGCYLRKFFQSGFHRFEPKKLFSIDVFSPEMDNKVREVVVRRGTSRFSPAKRSLNKQSGHKLLSSVNGGVDLDVSQRSKKEKIEISCLVNRESSSNEDSEMGGGSEEEMELSPPPPPSAGSGKRFKLHRKLLNDCNPVDHSSVPRKLRSAMNKRNRESVSPPLSDAKKLHHTSNGMGPHQLNSAKKSKQSMRQVCGSNQSQRKTICGPITKDEEEVVETLFALASMFPNNKTVKSDVDPKIGEAKSSPSWEMRESCMLTSEAPKEESMKSHYASINTEITNLSSNVEISPGETVTHNPLTKSIVLEPPTTVSENQKFDLGLDISTLQADPGRTSLLSKSEPIDDKPLSATAKLGVSSELCPGTGSRKPMQDEPLLQEQKQMNGLWPVASIMSKREQQQPTKDNIENGAPAMWPGLPTTVLCGGGVQCSTRSSLTEAPAWLDSRTCDTRIRSTEKGQPVIVDRKQSRKRCMAHVYITHLILAHQTTEKKSRWPIPPDQMKPIEVTKLAHTTSNILSGLRNNLSGLISIEGANGSITGRSLNEVQIGILLDRKPSLKTSGNYSSSQKQNCDFLSLSASGGGDLESTTTNDKSNHGRNGLESSAQLSVPYLHPIVQHHPLIPFSSLTHARYSASPYPDQLKAASAQQVPIQPPQYLGGPFCGPTHLGHVGSAKLQQQQQQMWATQLACQYGSQGILVSNFPKWQIGKNDSPSLMPCSRSIVVPVSSPSLEVLGARLPQQQHNIFPVSSSSSSNRGKNHQLHHLPGGYDEGVGSSHLQQVLCNAEH